MARTKPFEIIATRFGISGESAKYFLGRVQKSFKNEKPPQGLILEFMQAKKFKALPEPGHVANLMREGGVWAYPTYAEPPAAVDEGDQYFPKGKR